MVCYNMILDTTQFKDGSQKSIDYTEKWLYNQYIFVSVYALDPNNSVI